MKTSRIITSQRKRVAKRTLVERLIACGGGFFLSDILIFTAVALILTIAPAAAGQKSEPAVAVPKYVRRPSHVQGNSGRGQPSSSAIRTARRSGSSLPRIG
jgi:hypothetical protein